MTTKLEAINTMLSCIGQTPINTLQGTKSAFTVSAESILDSKTKSIQLQGWNFNTEENYPLRPDINGEIKLPENILTVDIPSIYYNRYVIRKQKIYDKLKHTFKIDRVIKGDVVLYFDFEDLPEAFKNFIKISAAYKFVKRELGSQSVASFTKEDVSEAYINLTNYELETGDYTLIPSWYEDVRRSL